MRRSEQEKCSTAIDLTKLELRGVWEFLREGTYRIDLEANGDWVTKFGPGCVTSACKDVQHALRRLFKAPGEPDADVTCKGTTVCTCTHAIRGTRMREIGPYVRGGGTVTLGTDNQLDYCAAGDMLELSATSGRGALGTDDDITGRLVLVRKKNK